MRFNYGLIELTERLFMHDVEQLYVQLRETSYKNEPELAKLGMQLQFHLQANHGIYNL